MPTEPAEAGTADSAHDLYPIREVDHGSLPWAAISSAVHSVTGEQEQFDPTAQHDAAAVDWIQSGVVAEIHAARRPSLAPTARFIELQRWEGVVESLSDDVFSARLFDKTDPSNPQEIGEFDLTDVDTGDRELVEPGAVFYWTIGYSENPTRSKQSTIRFRRLPMWSRRDIERVNRTARDLADYFLDDETPAAAEGGT